MPPKPRTRPTVVDWIKVSLQLNMSHSVRIRGIPGIVDGTAGIVIILVVAVLQGEDDMMTIVVDRAVHHETGMTITAAEGDVIVVPQGIVTMITVAAEVALGVLSSGTEVVLHPRGGIGEVMRIIAGTIGTIVMQDVVAVTNGNTEMLEATNKYENLSELVCPPVVGWLIWIY